MITTLQPRMDGMHCKSWDQNRSGDGDGDGDGDGELDADGDGFL
jgi:hypothetical protein